jgi:hypothetical protein
MADIEYLDQPPAGWFPVTVCPTGKKGELSYDWHRPAMRDDWVGLFTDLDPGDRLLHADCTAREVWVRVSGSYPGSEAAWEALLDLMETRH